MEYTVHVLCIHSSETKNGCVYLHREGSPSTAGAMLLYVSPEHKDGCQMSAMTRWSFYRTSSLDGFWLLDLDIDDDIVESSHQVATKSFTLHLEIHVYFVILWWLSACVCVCVCVYVCLTQSRVISIAIVKPNQGVRNGHICGEGTKRFESRGGWEGNMIFL